MKPYIAQERNVDNWRFRYAVVLTPDNGIIECRNISAALRIAGDMNALCNRISELDPNGDNGPRESDEVTEMVSCWQRK